MRFLSACATRLSWSTRRRIGQGAKRGGAEKEVRELSLVLKVRDEVSKSLEKISKKVGGLGSKLGSAIKAGALVGGAALIGLAGLAVKFGGDFNAAFNTIAQGTGATGEALKGLKDDFKAVLAGVPDDMGKVSSVIADLNTLTGLTGEGLQGMAKQVLDASRVMGVDAAGLVENYGRALNVFGADAVDDAKGAADVLDRLFVVSQDTGAGIDTLASQIQTFGPVLKNAGFNIIETTTLFGQLHKSGVDVTRIMPGINSFTRRLAEEGVTDLKGALFDVVHQMENAATDVEALNIATEAFGAEGAQRMVTAVQNGALSLDDLIEKLRGTDGAIQAAAKATETMGQKFSRMKNTVLVALEPLLTGLFNGILKGLDKLMPHVQKFSEEQMPKVVKAVQQFARDARPIVEGFLGSFVSGLKVLFPLVKGLFKFVFGNKAAMVAALLAIGAAIYVAFGPVGLAVAALVGIIALIGLVKDNWQSIKDTIVRVGDQILGFFKGLFDFVTSNKPVLIGAIIAIGAAIALAFGPLGIAVVAIVGLITLLGSFDEVWAKVKDVTSGAVNSVKDTVSGAFNDVKNAISDAINFVLDFIKEHWPEIAVLISGPFAPLVLLATDAFGIRSALVGAFGAVLDFAKGIWEDIKGAVSDAAQATAGFVSDRVDDVVGFFAGLPGRIGTEIGKLPGILLQGLAGLAGAGISLGKALGNGLIDFIEKAVNQAIGALNDLIKEFNEAGVLGLDLNPLTIPPIGPVEITRLAQGTRNFRGGLAVVGEQGPELVGLPRGSAVFSNRDSSQMGGTVINQHFTFNGPVDQDAAEFIIETMGEEFRRGGFPYMQRAT